MNKTYIVAATVGGLLFLPSVQAQVPQLINYQGRVVTGGTNFSGTGQFKFALVNSTGLTTFWSNDGTSVGGGASTAAVSLSVVNGLYSVLLGDATIPNMTAVPATVFTNSDVRLRIWFNDGVAGQQLFSPDQRIAAVGYAMMSANVPDGIITSNKLADSAVTSAKIADSSITAAKIANGTILAADLAPNSVDTTHIIDGQVMTADLANDAVNSPKVANGTLVGADLANNTITGDQIADDLDLGRSNVVGRLDVFYSNTASNQPGISLFGDAAQISTYGSDSLEQVRLWGLSYGEVLLHNSHSNNATAVRLTANGVSGGQLYLNNSNGLTRARLEGLNSGGALYLYQADGGTGVYIDGDDGGAGSLSLRSTNGSTRVLLDGDAGDGGGLITVANAAGATRITLDGQSTSSAGEISLFDANGTETLQVLGAESTTTGAELRVRTAAGQNTIELDGEYAGHGNAGAILLSKTNGVSTIQLYADYQGTGDGRVVTQELQITGGSDLSEQFDIKSIHEALKPGMIVCIDPKNPGQLVTSTKACDRTVAGVVSGAGGVKPGMLMGQQGTAADGRHPVALTGRVYCWVDARCGPIEPGDLITTSDTPGHGMKVTNPAKAQGAIIGKAMTGLAQGKGLVLILVSLQ